MESKRSCCSSSMCCGAPVEKGCLVFAIINAVLCVAASAGSLIFLIYILYTWFSESRGPSDMFLVYLFTGIAVGCCVASALALTFAVVLVMGLRSGNKGYVMAYLGYGVVVVVLSVLGCLGFIALEWGETQPMLYTLIPLGVSFLYSLLLLLVYQTYTVFSKSTPANHARLLNTYDL
ncbi:uncharacterized protein LOC125235421 [Leguminivora glycinivorella]|uniref:uncharacterized protein LOC125235421 n=1 Tax=Leguminivora glycinivorella TaxID=1035111 RepID=UPI00200BC218|nr:uncharacterized protein LOC125235421 [Leguminivora glycinivorella]